jgi:hypothetical protein
LLGAQNELLGIWVAYEIERLNLDLQLGTMELDPQGQWIDPGPIEQDKSETNQPQPDELEQALEPESIPLSEPLPLQDIVELP